MEAAGRVSCPASGHASNTLDEATRKRGLIILLIDIFLMWGGFFMVIPLLSVYYVDHLGWAAATIGVVLAVRQVAQAGLGPISGMIADRFGAKWLICAGMLVRAVAFLTLAWAHTFPLLLFSTLLAGLGGCLFDSPRNAAIAALTDESNRNHYYSLAAVVGALGTTLGTQTGAILLNVDFALIAYLASACFVVAALITAPLLPSVRIASLQGTRLLAGMHLALRDRPFLVYCTLLMGYYFLSAQFSISLPLVARDLGGSAAAIGWMYAVNAGITVVLGYPLPRLAARWLSPLPMLVTGTACMALGLGCIALISNAGALMLCVAFYALGTVLATPSQQTASSNLANPAALGSYFGLNSLSNAAGGGLGNISGGLLYDLGRRSGHEALPWLTFLLIGALSASGLTLLWRRLGGVSPSALLHARLAQLARIRAVLAHLA